MSQVWGVVRYDVTVMVVIHFVLHHVGGQLDSGSLIGSIWAFFFMPWWNDNARLLYPAIGSLSSVISHHYLYNPSTHDAQTQLATGLETVCLKHGVI